MIAKRFTSIASIKSSIYFSKWLKYFVISLFSISLIIFLQGCATVKPFSLADVPVTQVDPRVDGKATDLPEWENAARLPDIFYAGPASRAGFYYFQSRIGWTAVSVGSNASTNYPGHVFAVAHDIVGSRDPDNILHNFQVDDDHDWNSFEFSVPSGKATIWVFDNVDEKDDSGWLPFADGLDRSHLIPEGTSNNKIDDRGFIARLNDDPSTDVHWFEGEPEPGDASWVWVDWHYVFGRHHFGTSFQDVGLDTDPENAVPHEVYEFFAYNPKLDPNGPGDGEPPPWCIWWDWVTTTEKKSKKVIVIKDGSPRRATFTQTFQRKTPILRGQFWLHFLPPDFTDYRGAVSLGEIVVNQLDMVLENTDLTEKAQIEVNNARDAFNTAFNKGFISNDYNILFQEFDSAYSHLDQAKSAGMHPNIVADIEIQALSAVATFAAEKIIAIDAAGLPIESSTLQDLYGHLYEFGREINAMADGASQPTPRKAAKTIEPLFMKLSSNMN